MSETSKKPLRYNAADLPRLRAELSVLMRLEVHDLRDAWDYELSTSPFIGYEEINERDREITKLGRIADMLRESVSEDEYNEALQRLG